MTDVRRGQSRRMRRRGADARRALPRVLVRQTRLTENRMHAKPCRRHHVPAARPTTALGGDERGTRRRGGRGDGGRSPRCDDSIVSFARDEILGCPMSVPRPLLGGETGAMGPWRGRIPVVSRGISPSTTCTPNMQNSRARRIIMLPTQIARSLEGVESSSTHSNPFAFWGRRPVTRAIVSSHGTAAPSHRRSPHRRSTRGRISAPPPSLR